MIKLEEAACGPAETQFNVKRVSRSIADDESPQGKAMVYVLEVPWEVPITLRVAADGKWMGATKPASYLAFPVTPGVHHICVQWQSRFQVISKNVALNTVTAAVGHRYYFLADLAHALGENGVRLRDLDPEEGKELALRSLAAESQLKPPN